MIELKNKFLSIEDIQLLEDLKSSIKSKDIKVTCVGLYNHGKSSLLNVLIRDFEDSTFKTSDVRETIYNKAFNYGEIEYIDTPGLNATAHDDKRVFSAIKESDINLFVHTVTTGEFVENEIDFLRKIKTHWDNPREFIERTIFVLSRIDKADNQDDILNLIHKMQKQIGEIFETKAAIIPVSSKRYRDGVSQNKNILITKSNIEDLRSMIENLKNKFFNSILETRKLRLNNAYDKLLKQLDSKLQKDKLELAKQKQNRKEYLTALKKDFSDIEKTLNNMYSRIG